MQTEERRGPECRAEQVQEGDSSRDDRDARPDGDPSPVLDLGWDLDLGWESRGPSSHDCAPVLPQVQASPLPPSGALRRRHAWVLCGFLLLCAALGQRALISAALGGAISLVNLSLLERSVQRLLGGPQGPQPLALRLLLHMRLVFLFGLIAAVLLRTRLEPLAFTAGLSSAVPAVLWHGWKTRYL